MSTFNRVSDAKKILLQTRIEVNLEDRDFYKETVINLCEDAGAIKDFNPTTKVLKYTFKDSSFITIQGEKIEAHDNQYSRYSRAS